MGENTKIEWADHTFNGWIGCTKISPGCDHCYAEAYAKRVGRDFAVPTLTGDDNWAKPKKWNDESFAECMECGWRGASGKIKLTYGLGGFEVGKDAGWKLCPNCKKPTLKEARARVFAFSLGDVFDNAVGQQWRLRLFDLIKRTPNLDWLLLTKRISNVRNMVPYQWIITGFPKNIWLGVTIVNREEMLRDGPKLKLIPVARKFWSIEPLLGDLGEIPSDLTPQWIIVGGESGSKARPMHPNWVRSLRDQCVFAGAAFHFKQWGEHIPYDHAKPEQVTGRDVETFRDMPCYRVGKKAAGRLLDGREWNEVPVCAT